jgi:hypothetical protein
MACKKKYIRQRDRNSYNKTRAITRMKKNATKTVSSLTENTFDIKVERATVPKLALLYLAKEACEQGVIDKLIKKYEDSLSLRLLVPNDICVKKIR